MIKSNSHKLYISFGSNKGNRLNNLIKSLKEIEVQVGRVIKLSNIYKTKSWGFKSRDFYNGCVLIKTKFSPETVLKKLLSIEDSLGRIRDNNEIYSSREIDLDILFYDDLIQSTKNLTIPHPQIHKRNFVLIPLFDIAKDLFHPKINLSIKKLISISDDTLEPKKLDNNNYYVPFWDRYSFISIEGNIGVGKTTLSQKIKSHFDIELLSENYNKNPFLKEFYSNPKEVSLKLEHFFLTERSNQIKNHFAANKKRKTISDFWIGKSMIFGKKNLLQDQYKVFSDNFKRVYLGLEKPEIIIFLKQNTVQLQKQIIDRGRSFEKKISDSYLDSISEEYHAIFEKKNHFILIELNPKEVLNLKREKGQEHLYRKLINY